MKAFYIAQLVIGILGVAATRFFVGEQESYGLLAGVSVATINVIFVQFVWGRILGKKSVAWTLFIIVFKYTLLGTTLYFVAAKGWLPIGWFSLGLGTILLSIFRIRLGTF